jgi:UDP-N-acetylglucosamine--N-acetylmuramyl-(pentapeptide) pyrophosphoryl-undecaprenol N-acetylglucosamine transferase
LRFPNADFLFVGAKDKMEMQKVPQEGYVIKGLWIAGLQRQINLKNALFPFKLVDSLWKAWLILREFRPDVVIGTGGFASGPLLQMANILGIPTVLQEQNSFPGITNKLLGKKAKAICVAYENLERFFQKEKLHLTGNPVRKDLIDVTRKRDEAIAYYNLNTGKKTLLILGGSLGARRINQLIEKELNSILDQNVQIIWQCGKLYFDEYKKYVSENVRVVAFIEKMSLVYAASDVIISRAGASSVSELCMVGKPVVFIPSPNVAEDHQTKNAKAIVEKNGAIMIKESELDTLFALVFKELLLDTNKQNELSKNIKQLARPEATEKIVDEIVKLIR